MRKEPKTNVRTAEIRGKICAVSCQENHSLRFIYIYSSEKLYRICVPVNSVFMDIIPNLLMKEIKASILEVSVNDKNRYSLITID